MYWALQKWLSATTLLQKLGANVIVNDGKPLAENVLAAELQAKGMDVVCGGHPLELLERNISLVVKIQESRILIQY